jgi:hypothetical protein
MMLIYGSMHQNERSDFFLWVLKLRVGHSLARNKNKIEIQNRNLNRNMYIIYIFLAIFFSPAAVGLLLQYI